MSRLSPSIVKDIVATTTSSVSAITGTLKMEGPLTMSDYNSGKVNQNIRVLAFATGLNQPFLLTNGSLPSVPIEGAFSVEVRYTGNKGDGATFSIASFLRDSTSVPTYSLINSVAFGVDTVTFISSNNGLEILSPASTINGSTVFTAILDIVFRSK